MMQKKSDSVPQAAPAAPGRQHADRHTPFDPEMVYVECMRCGSPLIWNPGKTTELIHEYGVDPTKLDAQYIILTEGCRNCMPQAESYRTRLARITIDHDAPKPASGN